jgi:heptosyltransferase-3
MARDYAKILVLARPSIGDVLLSTPLISALRARWPAAALDVLVYAGQEGILEGNPDVDEVLTSTKHPRAREYAAQLRRIGRHYDLGLSVSTSDRAVWYLVATARERISLVPATSSWRNAWKRWVCTRTLAADPWGTHTLEQNNRLGRLAGVEPGYEVVPPRCADADGVLAQVLPGVWKREAYAVLHLTPGHPFKRWTLEGWRQLAAWLGARGLRIVLTGGDGVEERAYLEAARRVLPVDALDVAGRLRLGDLTLLLEQSVIYVGPDTVATHLAAAVGAPTLAIFGPTNPLKWAPWPQGYAGPAPPFRMKGTQRTRNVVLVQGPGACVPCQQLGCERHRASRSDCLDGLAPDVVIAAADALLREPLAPDYQASST